MTTGRGNQGLPRRRLTPAEAQTVRRLLDLPLPAIEAVLAGPRPFGSGTAEVFDGGCLRMAGAFAPEQEWPVATWRATATLRRTGTRLARTWRVRIEVAEWSHGGCEVTVSPVSRHVAHWGDRRQRRYYGLAHAAADHVARCLADAARRRQDRHLRAVVAGSDGATRPALVRLR